MREIICVHQGLEQYGSDKSFVNAVAALTADASFSPRVVLTGHGSIDALLDASGLEVAERAPLFVLRKADLWRALTVNLPQTCGALWRAFQRVRQHEIVYVNTVVVVDHILASLVLRKPIVVHVREIPDGIAMALLRRLLILAHSRVIFNSEATRDAFALPKGQHTAVVHNGVAPPSELSQRDLPVFTPARPLRVLCLGRLNAWKGQEVLVEALARLPEALRDRIQTRIVGGVFRDQAHFRTRLVAQIEGARLDDTIAMVDFADAPRVEYEWADLVVVPSTSPEPFGRVAIEAMSYGVAVIGTNHGGLAEIIDGGTTGMLVAPRDATALASALSTYLDNPARLKAHGTAGARRFQAHFTQQATDEKLCKVLREWSLAGLIGRDTDEREHPRGEAAAYGEQC